MADFDWTVKLRRPSRILTRPYEKSMTLPGQNVRASEYDGTFLSSYVDAVMLVPYADPGQAPEGKGGYVLQAGNPFVTYPDAWVEGVGAFGDSGGYVGFAGDATYPSTSPWAAR